MTDDQGRAWRWGKPLSREEAEALARRWDEGDIISEPERWERYRAWITERVGTAISHRTYGQLNEIRAWMQARGITELEEEADPNLVQQTLCEAICSQDVLAREVRGADMDAAYWDCMHECAPIIYPETLDPTDPLYPHSDEPSAADLTTTFSLPERTKK